MLKTKTTKQSIINKVLSLDKATTTGKKPQLVMIEGNDNKTYRIVEYYYDIDKQKELVYEDYNKYLSIANLDKSTPVIIDNIL